MKSYQEIAFNTIKFLLNECDREEIEQDGVRHVLNLLVRLYPEIKDRKITYRNMERCKINFQFSKDANFIARKFDKWEGSRLHYEHATPVKVTVDRILELLEEGSAVDDLVAILNESEVVIITKEQAEKLDSSEKKKGLGMRQSGSGEERMTAIDAELSPFKGDI